MEIMVTRKMTSDYIVDNEKLTLQDTIHYAIYSILTNSDERPTRHIDYNDKIYTLGYNGKGFTVINPDGDIIKMFSKNMDYFLLVGDINDAIFYADLDAN